MELNLLLSFFRTESGTRGCRTGATTGSNPVTLCSATSRRVPSASRSVADCWDQPEASPSPSSASSSQSFPKLFFSLLFRLWISFQYLSLVSPLLLSFAPLLLMLPPSGDDIAKLFWPQKIRYCQKFAAWLGNAPYPWSSLVQGDEGCIGAISKMLCMWQTQNNWCLPCMANFHTCLTVGPIPKELHDLPNEVLQILSPQSHGQKSFATFGLGSN